MLSINAKQTAPARRARAHDAMEVDPIDVEYGEYDYQEDSEVQALRSVYDSPRTMREYEAWQ